MLTLHNVKQLVYQCEAYEDTALPNEKFRESRYRMFTKDHFYTLSDNRVLTLKKGFIHDDNSVMWILEPLYPRGGIYSVPAHIHDALYYAQVTSREFADSEYVKWMLAIEIDPIQIRKRWWAVEKFGLKWWNKSRNKPSPRCQHNRNLITLE